MNRRRLRNLIIALLGLALVLSVFGCTDTNYLVYRQSTIIGMDVEATPSQTNPKVKLEFGYDRESDAYVPQKRKEKDGAYGEAMSIISKSYVEIGFLEGNEVHEHFATGKAANRLTCNPQNMNKFFGLIEGADNSQNPPDDSTNCPAD